jgi:hypothetical protein
MSSYTCASCTTYSPCLIFRSKVWLPSLCLGTRLLGKDKKIIIRVVAPPSTNWSERSALTPAQRSLCRRPVGWTARCLPTNHSNYSSLGLHRQLCWLLTSCTGDFSTFGFSVQLSLAERGTPRHSCSPCKSGMLSWGLPWWLGFAISSLHLN